jgi:hypothetical protein
MAESRVYWFDAADHIQHVEDYEWGSDADAYAAASAMIRSFPSVEVWCGARLIGRIVTAPARGGCPDSPPNCPKRDGSAVRGKQ